MAEVVGVRILAWWDCGLESRWGYGCLSLVSVGICQVEVPATVRSLVRRYPTDCDASLCVISKPRKGKAMTRNRVEAQRGKKKSFLQTNSINIQF